MARLSWRSASLLIGLGLVLLVFGFYRLQVAPALARAKQARASSFVRELGEKLLEHKAQHGSYPLTLLGFAAAKYEQPLDGWKRPYLYLSEGDWFILVSLGQDGLVGQDNLLILRREGSVDFGYGGSECRDLGVDLVFTDRGPIRLCGK